MSAALRVMVVDDSAYNRRTIGDLLSRIEGVDVVGKAADGDEALRLAASLVPDLITLDLEMPRMDGFTFLRLLMARQPTPVVVISGNSARENVFRALELGALDFIAKPQRSLAGDLSSIEEELKARVAMVRQLTPAGRDFRRRMPMSARTPLAVPTVAAERPLAPALERPVPLERTATAPERPAAAERSPAIVTSERSPFAERPAPERAAPLERSEASGGTGAISRLIVIGASTGGPTALMELFSSFKPGGSAAVVVAQHMPERFTKTFAERLHKLGGLRVSEARDFEPLHPGRAVLCPGGKCLEIVQFGHGFAASVMAPQPTDRFIPSVDRLFRSAAEVAGERVVGVVLTGMGDDGARGVVAIKARGGTVYAESQETAVIYGMPGAAVRTGEVDKSLPLSALAQQIAELVV
jgi:two-component system, chemotaxis family, protein-glutamate methylesterase/glutaminase